MNTLTDRQLQRLFCLHMPKIATPSALMRQVRAQVLAEVNAAQKCGSCNGSGNHSACGGRGCGGCWNTGDCPDCLGVGWEN